MILFRRNLRAAVLAVLAAAGLALASASALASDGPALTGVVNVNTASIEELQLLPGIGEARARAILEAHKARGGFRSVDDLVEVKGIGSSSLERLRPFVTLKGKTNARIE